MNDSLKAIVADASQEHVLDFYNELSSEEQSQLSSQLEALDFTDLKEAVENVVLSSGDCAVPTDFDPASYWPLSPENDEQKALYAEALTVGEAALKESKVAAFTVAGGQGTRLGYDGPKGTLPVSPVENKTLFQIFAESILGVQDKYGSVMPWYIMTSPINHEATVAHFKENNFFGLDKTTVKFFSQAMLPAFSTDGKMLLASKSSLALSPNGHGGSLKALIDSGALADMKERGVEHLSYFQVDNPLVSVIDPLFLGLHLLKQSDVSSRSLTKTGPFEKLGNFVLVGEEMTIVEYSDLDEDKAQERDAEGRLRYRAGSPAIHLMRADFLAQFADSTLKLPYHRADKKVPFIDAQGIAQTPEEPNAVKIEMFIFDALPMAKNPIILEADRAEEFSPVKNKTGVDSLESLQADLNTRAQKWLTAAGVTIEENAIVELSPRTYTCEADVLAKKNDFPTVIEEGQKVYFA